jgi:hypothetical protein
MRFAIGQPSQVQKPLTRLVNSLSLIPLAYLFEQLGLAGLHSGIGPSSALSIGVAIATYVQAKPTIRINILTARFMVFSLRWETPGRKPRRGGIIQRSRGPSSLFSSAALGAGREFVIRDAGFDLGAARRGVAQPLLYRRISASIGI